MILFRDYETHSSLDLIEVGPWKYASGADTDVWCCAFAVDDEPIKLWVPGDPVPAEFIEAARNPDWLVSAFNDGFERQIESHIMGPRYGWPVIPLERHRCTQAASLSLSLPGSLEGVAEALSVEQQKDREGRALMLKMAKGGVWPETDKERLYAYCRQDVATERDVHARVGHLGPEEQKLWVLDAQINDRGIHLDRALIEAAIKLADAAQSKADAELSELTGGAVETSNQVQKLCTWLREQGCDVYDAQRETLETSLKDDLPPQARKAIELRLGAPHAATKKFRAMIARLGADDRVRDSYLFHRASTGRWSSTGIQLQNMKRAKSVKSTALAAVLTGDLDHVAKLFPKPMTVVGGMNRATITAAPGHLLIGADFSGVESRLTAWVSGQQSKINQWAKFDASGDPADEPYVIVGRQCGLDRDGGKTCDLAFGYNGGEGAYRRLAGNDDSTPSSVIDHYRDIWRARHPKTVYFWEVINTAAIKAVREPGRIFKVNLKIAFAADTDLSFLRMRLPNGRLLSYPFPKLTRDRKFGNVSVVYMDNLAGKWVPCRGGDGAWPGLWTENVVQAIARDLFAAAMMRLDAAGYHIVAHTHDEIVAEMPFGTGSKEEFTRILTALPEWAAGLPVAAKSREGPRFCKVEHA